MSFGLPYLLAVIAAQRLGGTASSMAAAAAVSVLIASGPLVASDRGLAGITSSVIIGRSLVIASVWMVALLVRQRELARWALHEYHDDFEEEISRRTGELRRVNVQLHREINERRRAEHRSRYLAAIVETSDDAIISQSMDGTIASWNQGATRVYGYDRQEMIGKPSEDLVPYEREGEMHDVLARVARGERVDAFETVRLRKDGILTDVSVCVSPILDDKGTIVGVSLIERDITKLKQTEEALQSLNAELEQRVHDRTEQLEQALTELETFNYSVTHDLRGPLRAIRGFGETLGEDGRSLTNEDRTLLARMVSAAGRMDATIDALLELSRAGNQRIEKEIVDLAGIARSVIDELAAQPDAHTVEWSIGEGLLAWGDPALLRLVVQNLLENAHKYTARTEAAHVRFEVEGRDDDAITYAVRDDGAGFAPELASKLFHPFQRLHRREEFDGSGIGLATAERIVRRHGGKIWAESDGESGAVFRFRLPIPARGAAGAMAEGQGA